MNRHCYRVLFNRARGLFVVCQENARSAGGSSSSPACSAASALRFVVVSLVATACALLCVDLAHGQIIADPSALGRQRPTVLSAPNGVPVVNIQTPSAAGVSHNTYRQFDVNAPGAVLNNSRGNVQTQLGGWVQGNPWLAQGSARVILNEVNSSNPSLLRGAVEVAGPRAEVIIANPSGITVNGGSFINTSRVTLTTGSPVMNAGNLESYRVQRGNVLFEGRGLDAGATDYTTILARAVQVNAGIWAKDLKVVAGAHEASAGGSVATPIAGTGPAPGFLLDVAALGGMYAGHIFLVGTEAGLGVRNAGNIASTGTLSLTADGKLINSGSLLAQTDLSLQAGAIDNRGSVEAGGSARLASLAGEIGNAGGTVTARRLELQSAADIDNRGGNLRQTGAGVLQVAAAVLDNSAGGTVGNRPVADSGGGTNPTNPTRPPVDPVTPTTTAPTPPTTPATTTTPNTPDLTPGTIRAQGVLRNTDGKVASSTGITLAAGRVDNSGGFVAVDRVTGPVVLANAGGELRVAGDLSLTGPVLDNRAGKLLASGVLSASVGRADNTGGVVQASALKLNADGDIDNSAGTLRATAATATTATGIDIRAGGMLRNDAGQIESAAHTKLVADRVDGDAGRIVELGNLDIRTTGDTLARQSTWTAGGTLNAAAGGTLDIRGAALDANQSLRIDARALDNRGGRIVGGSGVAVAIKTGLLNDGGLVHAATDLDIGAGSALSNRGGSLESAGKAATLAIRAADIDSSDGRIVNAGTGATTVAATGALNLGAASSTGTTKTLLGGNGSVDITAGSLQIAAGSTVAASGALSLAVDGAAVNAGSIAGVGTVRLSAASLDNRTGRIEAADTLAVTSTGLIDNRTGTLRAGHALALNAGGDISNDRGAIEAVATDATLSIRTAATLDNGAGRIANAGTGATYLSNLAASHIVNAAAGTLLANGALQLQSTTLDNQAGANIGAGSLVLDVSDTAANRGTIASNGALALVQTAATLDNRAGRITAAGAVDLQLQRLLNDGGSIATTQGSGALLALDAGQLTNTGGTLSSDGELRIKSGSDFTNAGLLHAGGDLGLNVAGALVNTGTLEAAGTLRTDSTSLTNRSGAVIQAGKVDLNTPGALVNAGEISGSTVVAHADSIANTGGITVRSGGDTTLQGAVVKGRQVVTDTRGDLLIESLQDTSTFDSKNKSASASLTIGPTGPTAGSASFGKSQVNADYASVVEQSGIQAGDGGFQVRTQGNTSLVGGVIASTQKAVDAGNNSFATGSLTQSDIQNKEDFKASGFSIGAGYTAAGTGKPSDGSKADGVTGQGGVPNTTGGMNTPAVGFGSASGHQSSTTSSGISGVAGNKEVRTGDSSNGLAKTFDADKVTKEVAAQVQITSTFNQQAASAIGDYADQQRIAAIALRTQADQEPDPAKQAQLRESAQTLENNWGPNGTLRIAAQGVVGGLSGGLSGALGAVSGAVAAPAIADALAAAHIEGPLASAITAAASAAVGGLLGGSVGASTSVNEVVNNYLQHSTNWRSSQWGAFKEELARCQATSGCNVDGVYQRWTAIGNDQQKAAMSSMDAMLGADPSAAAEAGKSFGAAAAAMSVSPADVCAAGDARCAGFVGQQNNQAAAILRTGLVVAYANDLVEVGGKGKSTSATTNESPGKSAAENAAELAKTKVEAEIAALKKIGQNPDGPVLEGKAPNSVLNQQAVNDLKIGVLPGTPIGGPGSPREMPASLHPSATAEDFAIRSLGRQPTASEYAKAATMNGGDCPGCWVGSLDGQSHITYRPAGASSIDTLPTTATVEINLKKIDPNLNNGQVIKFKFPK